MIIELLKLSAIAFKSYMPEMKLKNQNLLHNFKSSVKSLEAKMSIIERLDECLSNAGLALPLSTTHSYTTIKHDIKKVKYSNLEKIFSICFCYFVHFATIDST